MKLARRGFCAHVIAALVVVVWVGGADAQNPKPSGGRVVRQIPSEIIVGKGAEALPPGVAEMRLELLTAVERGDLKELRRVMELNELKPDVGAPAGADPIEHLRQSSADGKGLTVLLRLGKMLEGRWAAIPGGRDVENNRLYVWPHFAEVPLAALSESDKSELNALVGETAAGKIIATGKWQGWRLAIGADGVWHTLVEVTP